MSRGLSLVVLTDDATRLQGGLVLAVSAAALNRRTRLFFQGQAVALLAANRGWPSLPDGVADIDQLFDQAQELGIDIAACETGLHGTGLTAADLRPGIQTFGTIGFLSAGAGPHGDDDIIAI
ncbi:MAG: DsrE family protein [Pseudomonadota bacterium]